MSMHPKGPIPRKQPQQVQVDLKQADTIKCKSCGNYLFIQSFVLKKLSSLVSPTGKEEMIPIIKEIEKPLMGPKPKAKRNIAANKVVKFESSMVT